MSNKDGEGSKVVPEARNSKLINLRLSEKELRILEVIRIEGEDYESAIKRALWESFEYSLVRDAISAIDDRLTDLISERIYDEQSYPQTSVNSSTYGYPSGREVRGERGTSRSTDDEQSEYYDDTKRNIYEGYGREEIADNAVVNQPDREFSNSQSENLDRRHTSSDGATQPHISQKILNENIKGALDKAIKSAPVQPPLDPEDQFNDVEQKPEAPSDRNYAKRNPSKNIDLKELLERKWIKVGNGYD